MPTPTNRWKVMTDGWRLAFPATPLKDGVALLQSMQAAYDLLDIWRLNTAKPEVLAGVIALDLQHGNETSPKLWAGIRALDTTELAAGIIASGADVQKALQLDHYPTIPEVAGRLNNIVRQNALDSGEPIAIKGPPPLEVRGKINTSAFTANTVTSQDIDAPHAAAAAHWKIVVAAWGTAFPGVTPDPAVLQLVQAVMDITGVWTKFDQGGNGEPPLTTDQQIAAIVKAMQHQEDLQGMWNAIWAGDANKLAAALLREDTAAEMGKELGLDHAPTPDELAAFIYKTVEQDCFGSGEKVAVRYEAGAAGDKKKSSGGIWVGVAVVAGLAGAAFLAWRYMQAQHTAEPRTFAA